MNISVIISTYNNTEWLQKVLWGYEHQTYTNFEVIIADDGSGKETFELIDQFNKKSQLTIKHVWHEDNGFQKSAILNLATIETSGEYLIFTDGDCIPRPDFIETHVRLSGPDQFLSGGYCKLPMNISKLITQDDIVNQLIFDTQWLKKQGDLGFSSTLKIGLTTPWNRLADKITTTKPTWNGCNASTWKKHILEVNGHNEEMQYGGQDREMGERLLNLGLKPMQVRHQAILLHLDHPRSYKTDDSIQKNLAIRSHTKSSGITRTPNGIKKELDK